MKNIKTILDFFEISKNEYPDKVAVKYKENSLTYRELDEMSDHLASFISKKAGTLNNDFIGVMLEKNQYFIVAILAVIKLGCAYVPIDINSPEERLSFIKEDSNCQLIIDKDVMDSFLTTPKEKTSLSLEILPEDFLYLIYTSGTTGNPKGVAITHSNLINLLFHEGTVFDFQSSDVWTVFHSQCFDFSVWEIFCPLLTGGMLIILDKETAQDPVLVKKNIEAEGVTMLSLTPSAFYALTPVFTADFKPNKLRHLFFGGEKLLPVALSWWRKNYPELQFMNLYGATETTIHTTYKVITDKEISENISNIGKALPGYQCFVVGKYLEKVPFGAEGELAVAGGSVARGYINNEELTHNKFVDNPYGEGEKLYLTGDIVKLMPNGEMIYKGRKDRQVKIRGHRIELGEIETVILKNIPEISQVVAEIKEFNNDQLIVCYYSSEEEINKADLANRLKDMLPEYMIPKVYIRIDKFVLNVNGKISYEMLPDVSSDDFIKREFVPAKNEIQKELIAIWEDVLGIENIGIEDDFFELGGDSLNGIKIVNTINKKFEISMNVVDVFEKKTIWEMSELLEFLVGNYNNPNAEEEFDITTI
ncbi:MULTISPECIES: non-ribosomal peptide synthetase [Chryseobacterium]|uniref:non-ribosomal peptide synthetase n=1 Tax=Chryseobacterium TaxID=59732 RepID=UPI00162AA6F6|nr:MULTISPECIES: non-ribosomal peptide synthetase [Chryseobacterium]MDM1553025.1 non-ribosomal peptide synthetase [Chryseobacterium indologenes]